MESVSSKVHSSFTLPVLLDPFGAIVGPLVGNAGRPCLKCLSKRLKSRAGHHAATLKGANLGQRWPKTFWMKLDAILQEEVLKIRSKIVCSPLERGAFLFDFLNQRGEYEEVFPIPGCECSTGYEFR